jgi:DNA-binding NarL/FixJ family response regulator
MDEVLTTPNASDVVLPADRNSPLLSFEDALKTPTFRKMPSTMRAVATARAAGKAPGEIARELKIPEEIVEKHIRQMVLCLRCQPPAPVAIAVKNRRAASRLRRRGSALAGIEQMETIEANCQSCGCRIEEGEERIVLAAMAIHPAHWDEDSAELHSFGDVRKVFHFCQACSNAEEFRVANPWHLTPEERKWIDEREAESGTDAGAGEVAEATTMDEQLCDAVANGDMHSFNKLMPTERARRDDVMVRAFTFSRLEEKAGISDVQTGGSEEEGDCGIVDYIVSTNSPSTPSVYDAGSRASGEFAQRARVLEYLNSPASRGKFTEETRKLLKMWAEDGLSQNELSRKLGINQGTISKRIRIAIRLASAPR